MKLKQLFLFFLFFSCLLLIFVLGFREVKSEETKSETIYKYIQATQDTSYIPDNYQYTNWRERATQFNEMLFNMNDYFCVVYEKMFIVHTCINSDDARFDIVRWIWKSPAQYR